MKEFLTSLFWPTLAGVLAAVIVLNQWVLKPPSAEQGHSRVNSYSAAVATATPSVVKSSRWVAHATQRPPRRFLGASNRARAAPSSGEDQ